MFTHIKSLLLLVCIVPCLVCAQTLPALLDSARKYKSTNSTKTIAFAQKAYARAKATQQDAAMGESAYIMGIANYLNGDKDEALRLYVDAEKHYSACRDTAGLIRVYSELCILYLKIKKIPNSLQAADTAISYARAMNNTDLLATAYNNKGLVYMDTRRFDTATLFFNLAYNTYSKINSTQGMAYSLDYLASVSAESNQPQKALAYLKQSIALLAACGDKFGEAMSTNNIGELLLRDKKPAEALVYFKDAINKSKAIKYDYLEDNAWLMMANCYNELGDNKRAYDALQQHLQLHDKIVNENTLKKVEELSARYETGKKEQQNKLLKEQNDKQAAKLSRNRIVTAAVIIIACLLVGMLYLFYNRYKLKQQARYREDMLANEKLRARAIVDAEESERRRLARELHDGIGQTLAATHRKLQSIPATAGLPMPLVADSIAMVDSAIKEARQLSHNMMPPWLRNKTLVQAIEDMLHNMRASASLTIQTEWVDIKDLHLDELTTLMLYRSIQELTSNVLRHAQATELNVEIVNHNTELTIMIYDNGIGFDKGQVMAVHGGIGLKNIQSRIDFIGGQLEIDSYPGKGTTCTITVPLNNRHNEKN